MNDNSTSPFTRARMRLKTIKTLATKGRKRKPRYSGATSRTVLLKPTRPMPPIEYLPQDPRTEEEFLASNAGRIYEPGLQSYPDE